MHTRLFHLPVIGSCEGRNIRTDEILVRTSSQTRRRRRLGNLFHTTAMSMVLPMACDLQVLPEHCSPSDVMLSPSQAVAKSAFFFFFFLFFPSHLLSSHFCLSSSIVVTQIRGHKAGSSPPSPLRYVPSLLSREEFIAFFPRRLESNSAYPHY